MRKLRLGKISYINTLPVFRMLEKSGTMGAWSLVESYPSDLNRMLREGLVDVSPSSSFEYLTDEDEYTFLPGHSISARGKIGSILLFSRRPIEALGGARVAVTHQSATSVALLKVILGRFLTLNASIEPNTAPLAEALKSSTAYLSIGDEALALARMAIEDKTAASGAGMPHRVIELSGQRFLLYDLSELWHLQTGLPMVFALWILKKKTMRERAGEIAELQKALDEARDTMKAHFAEIGRTPGLVLPPDEAVAYWEGIIYSLPDDCLRGLELFKSYTKGL